MGEGAVVVVGVRRGSGECVRMTGTEEDLRRKKARM